MSVVRVDREPAFVLAARPYRETSALLELLTRDHGRVGLVARGVRGERPRFGRSVVVPLQALEVAWQARGELGTLIAADPVGAPMPLAGEALLSALYLNELLVRILPRHAAHPELIGRYAATLGELALGEHTARAWALRRFERDLLNELGIAPSFDHDAAGVAIAADRRYRVTPESGFVAAGSAARADDTISGRALIHLGGDSVPPGDVLGELKATLRELLRHQLDGSELKAWSLGSALRRYR